jgi:hypothetical protein
MNDDTRPVPIFHPATSAYPYKNTPIIEPTTPAYPSSYNYYNPYESISPYPPPPPQKNEKSHKLRNVILFGIIVFRIGFSSFIGYFIGTKG